MPLIHCSTTGSRSATALDYARRLIALGAENVELSGGRYSSGQVNQIKRLSKETAGSVLIHNYFPIPKESFVLNLASNNKSILSKSIQTAKKAIEISSNSRLKKYGVHSGFLLDPQPSELGGLFNGFQVSKRDEAINIFRNSVMELWEHAQKFKVELLLENNVSNMENLRHHKEDIFLLSRPVEILKFFQTIPADIGLLLDVGHLHVTGKTYGFDTVIALKDLAKISKGYHLSENDGKTDQHLAFSLKEWRFKNYLRKDLDYYTLEFKDYDFENLIRELETFQEWF